jgi:hypothetical protein
MCDATLKTGKEATVTYLKVISAHSVPKFELVTEYVMHVTVSSIVFGNTEIFSKYTSEI